MRSGHYLQQAKGLGEDGIAGGLRWEASCCATIGQARANFAMTMMAACYNLKRLVYLQKAGVEAF